MTGLSRRELIGTDFSDYFTEPDKAREGYQQVLREGSVTDYPLALRHRMSERVTDVLYNASVYRNEKGEVAGVFAAARDVTERKRAEEELRKYHEHLEELVSGAHRRNLKPPTRIWKDLPIRSRTTCAYRCARSTVSRSRC